jgi:NADPH2:quinone reductase
VVYAVDSATKADYISSLGATPIDRAAGTVEDHVAAHTAGRGFDIVYDTVGGEGLDAAFKAVSRSGHVVSSLGWGTHALAPLSFRAATYSGVFTLLPLLTGEGRARHGEIMREVTRHVEAGRVAPRLDDRRFALADTAAAHALIETGRARGKLVIEVD